MSQKTGAAADGGGADGKPENPYPSIGAALGAARALGATIIVVDEGTYAEKVVLDSFPKGITVDGSWSRTGATWSRDCSDNRVLKTLIQSPEDIGVVFDGLQTRSVLANLAVRTRATAAPPPGEPGTSRIGVLAKNSVVALENVSIVAANGDPGGAATAGTAGIPLCATSLACVAAGKAGRDGDLAPPPVGPGTFDDTGFKPVDGNDGAAGEPGENGKRGGDAGSRSDCELGCEASGGCGSMTGTVKSNPGQCGCGGAGGTRGSAGKGGSASVALLAVGGTVSVKFSELVAGDGGDASPGGTGGPSSAGHEGAVGTVPTKCWTPGCCTNGQACPGAQCGCYGRGNWNAICTTPTAPPERLLAGGTAGGAGAAGGKGSNGSGGAGGPAFAYVPVNGAQVLIAESKRAFGRGGNGAIGGVTGEKP